MYNIYINHFKRNNSIVNTEELMFAVPLVNNAHIQKPMVKSSEDSADSFSFTMDSNSPYYDAILAYKTEIRVEYDGDIIFWGRAHEPTMSSVFQTKSVQCDGTYVFFNDTYYEGVQEKYRKKISLNEYFTKVLNNHNSMAPDKQIFKGDIGVTLSTKEEKYEPTSWSQTMSLLSELTSNNGGHFRIRYTNEDPYLDWYKYYIRDLGDGYRPKVKIGINILDISTSVDKDTRFTKVIPIGATNKDGKTIYIDGYVYKDKNNVQHTYSGKAMPVSFIRNIYTNSQLTDEFHDWTDYRDSESNYGSIYKTMSFEDADTQKKLFDEVVKWIKESYFPIRSSFTVKAIDMHILDDSESKILLGDCVDIQYLIVQNGSPTWNTKKLVCTAVQYDLYNPENNSYTFGFPSDLLDVASRKKSSKATVSNDVGNTKKPITQSKEDETVTWRKIWHMIGTRTGNSEYEGTQAALSFYENGELEGTVYCIDPNEITTGAASELNQKKFEARLVGKITLTGKSIKWIAIAADRGIFAYTENRYVKVVSYWYTQHKGYKYEGSEPGTSSIETIASMIEKDRDPYWGGTAAANSFRSNGKISGTVNKCYDLTEHTEQEAKNDPNLVFTAEIVGKFTLNGILKYVAISKEYGVFGFNGSARNYVPATHWYQKAKGLTYDNVSGFISTEDGNVYATIDGTPDGNKTISFSPTALSYPEYDATKTYSVGALVTYNNKIWKCKTAISTPEAWNSSHWDMYGDASVGQAFVGYDLTGSGDKWKIKLNTPIQYTDADGNVQIVDGFVSASDFSVKEIPSFKTKIGIFDIVIAGKVEAQSISADLAELRKMLGNVIVANTGIRTDKIWTNFISSSSYSLNTNDGGHQDVAYLQNCFSNCLVYPGTGNDSGKIFFQFSKIGGGVAQTVNFNIADTQVYKDALDSARAAVSIGSVIYTPQSGDSADRSLNPGQWAKAQGTFVNKNGQTVTTNSYKLIKANTDSNLIASNIKKDVVIFGVTGSYDSSSSPHIVTNFSTSAPSGQQYVIGGTTYTNNSSGYVIMSGSGSSANVACIVKGTWKCDGNDENAVNYLQGAPTAIYRAAYSAGQSSATPSSIKNWRWNPSTETWEEKTGTVYIGVTGSITLIPFADNHEGTSVTVAVSSNSVTMEYLYSETIEEETYYVFSTTKNLGMKAGTTKTFRY